VSARGDQLVEVHGLDQLASGSLRLAENIGRGAGDAFEQVASSAASVVRSVVPKLSGSLAGSVVVDLDRSTGTALVGMGGEGVPYAGWIEFGGGRAPGRPYLPQGRYLTPTALDASRDLEAVGEGVAKSEIRRMQWERPK